ncbi:outer membrane protein assembly factor BamD [bacterium]|nr:outer membrane protein assembly factor BamD [bacterium]
MTAYVSLLYSRHEPPSQRGTKLPSLPARLTFASLAVLTLSLLPGCMSSRWLAGRDSRIDASALKKGSDDSDLRTIEDVIGPLQRQALANTDRGAKSEADRNDNEKLKDGLRLYEAKQYVEAERVFEGLIKSRNPNKFSLFKKDEKRPKYDPIREEAMYFLAESQYQREELANAAARYQGLIKDYPSTRYLDESTRRLFDISRRWLGVEDFASTSEVQQVSLEDGAEKGRLSNVEPKKRGFSLFPNLTDKSRPAMDLDGHALKNLKTIWMNDPSGPLADDAIMLAATHYLRKGSYRDADRLLTMLREQFPKSTHLQTAFVLGSHVKLMSYQGSRYDEQLLTDAKELKENTLRLFPDIAEADRIRSELKVIHDAEARRDWQTVLFYEKKRNDKAVAVYCQEVMKNFPDTKYADLARQKLAALRGTEIAAAGASSKPADRAIVPFQSQPETGTGRVRIDDSTPALQPVPQNSGPKPGDGPVFEPDGPIFDDDAAPSQSAEVQPAGRVRL